MLESPKRPGAFSWNRDTEKTASKAWDARADDTPPRLMGGTASDRSAVSCSLSPGMPVIDQKVESG